MLDNHALRVFLEAARTENFTEAGRLLNLTQPAVSMQIRSLENYLQVDLFEREGRSIRLTKAGQALVPLAQQIVQMAVAAEETIRSVNGRVAGNLTIGCSTASGKYILPRLVARFRSLYPQVRVTIPVVTPEAVLEGVSSGVYDLGVVSEAAAEVDLGTADFFTDRLVLIVPAGHQWTPYESIEPEALLAEQFICREPEAPCRMIIDRGLSSVGLNPEDLNIVMEVGNQEALAMAVEHGIGVSFVSLLAASPRLALGRLAIVNVCGLELSNPVQLVYATSRPASPVRTKFLEFVEQPQNRTMVNMLADGRMV
jgi:DNA-binding transcriptional LysR family regulator